MSNPFKKEDTGIAGSGLGGGLDKEQSRSTLSDNQQHPPGEQAAEKAEIIKAAQKEDRQKEQLAKLSGVESLDWKRIPPPMLAQILTNIPFKGSGTDPDYYLAPWQALIFAMRCFELELSPFSNEVWYNPKNNKVNVTFEGKLKLARSRGFNLGPPNFERVEKPVPGKPIKDWGYRCTMQTPTGQAEYTAWHSEWAVASSPVWKAKPDHMLQLRAAEKCLSFASGIGASELPDDRDIAGGGPAQPVASIDVPEFVDKSDQINKEKK